MAGLVKEIPFQDSDGPSVVPRFVGFTIFVVSIGLGAGFMRKRSFSISRQAKVRPRRASSLGLQVSDDFDIRRCIFNADLYASVYFKVG